MCGIIFQQTQLQFMEKTHFVEHYLFELPLHIVAAFLATVLYFQPCVNKLFSKALVIDPFSFIGCDKQLGFVNIDYHVPLCLFFISTWICFTLHCYITCITLTSVLATEINQWCGALQRIPSIPLQNKKCDQQYVSDFEIITIYVNKGLDRNKLLHICQFSTVSKHILTIMRMRHDLSGIRKQSEGLWRQLEFLNTWIR